MSEKAWLVEQTSAYGGPRWLAVDLGAWWWTRDSLEACRFGTEPEARGCIALLDKFKGQDVGATPKEHEWL